MKNQRRSRDNAAVETARKPLLKWAGGKSFIVPHLLPLWQKHLRNTPDARLVEPFAGSIAVSVGLNPETALLNDFNPHVINLYKWIQKGLRAPFTPVNSEFVFYEFRSLFNQLISAHQVNSMYTAYLFYYLNRTCYRGLSRFNQKGEFNTPFGHYKKVEYLDHFSAFDEIISNWNFQSADFADIEIFTSVDFVFADPPYDCPFKAFTAESFSWNDQKRVAEWLFELGKKGVPVITTNEMTPRIEKLYKSMNFKIQKIRAPRLINSNGDRTDAIELFATLNI